VVPESELDLKVRVIAVPLRGGKLLLGALTAVLALPTAGVVATTGNASTATTPARMVADEPTPQAGDGPAVRAKRTGQRVELEELRTETAQVFVEPSGNHTLVQYAYPVRARKGGKWLPIDTTLRFQPDGSVRPGATVSDLELSGGGAGAALVALGNKSAQVRMGWSGRLPKPILAGDTATYPELLPGVDLKIRAQPIGFAQVLVVKTRAAALNPALWQIRFPLSSAGLTISSRPDGTTVATDKAGRSVFSAGSAVMWDTPAATAEPSERQAAAHGGSAAARHATIPAGLVGRDLVIRPDQTLLTSATTRFPLYVDPSWAGDQYLWTHVNQMAPDQSYWNFDRAEGAKVGYSWDGAVRYRSFFQMRTDALNGARVIAARFDITLDHSPTGSPTPTDLFQTRTIDNAVPLTWNNSGGHWSAYLATASGNAWTNGGQPDMGMGFSSPALKNLVQQVADQRTGTLTLGLRAPAEDDKAQWKRFRPDTARLVVTYNNPARAPIKVNFTRPQPCGTAAAPTAISTTQPSLSAVASDPDGDNITTRLAVHRASDNGLEYQVDSSITTSGAAFGWPQLPAGELFTGQTYYFVARSNDNVPDDGVEFGPDSEKCYFAVDSVRPLLPRLESADYPDGEPVLPARTTGLVTLRPAVGDTDVVEYIYGFQQDKVTLRIKAGADGTAKVPLTVWPDPGTGVPTRRLYVRAVDRAGNVSGITPAWDLSALDNTAPVPHVRGDINGDGRSDVNMVLDHGYGRTAVWNVTARAGGFNTGNISWDSGDSGGFPLYRTRAVQGDFDGDGRADLGMFREEPGRRVALYSLKSDGNRYDSPAAPLWNSGSAGWALSSARIISGEVTGDTKADIVVQLNTGAGNWRTLVFAGGNLATPVQWSQTAINSGEWAQSAPVLADVDGDGRDDLVNMKNLGGCRTLTEVYKSSGTAFAGAPVTLHDSGANGYCWERSKPAAGDLDGDGKDDIVAIYENGNTDTSLKVFRSSGTALTLSEWWHDTATFDPAKTALSVGDYSKDGNDDVALVYSTDGGGREVYTLTSNGTSFAPAVAGWKEAKVGASLGPKFDIEHRTYELVSRNSGRCLEIAGASQADPAPAQQWDCFGGVHQRFRIEQVAGTEQFEVHTVHANGAKLDSKARCLDVNNQSAADNEPVLQWLCAGTANQQVLLEYVEGSSYDTVVRLRFAHSGKCGAIVGGDTGNGAKVVQQPCAAVASQQWILRAALNTPQLDGRYKVTTMRSPFVLDISNCKPEEGVRVWDWVEGSPCQKWQVKPLGDDVYQIVDPSSGKALAVESCSQANLAKVIVSEISDADCQRWRIEPAVDGSWSIQQFKTGKSLDVDGCSPDRGVDLIIWPYWNGPCQRWKLEKQA
jgi:hypothetical protein